MQLVNNHYLLSTYTLKHIKIFHLVTPSGQNGQQHSAFFILLAPTTKTDVKLEKIFFSSSQYQFIFGPLFREDMYS